MSNHTQQYEAQLKLVVADSLHTLYGEDGDLISRKVNERSIVARFKDHFQKIAAEYQWFQDYNIDVEYNRNMNKSKCTPLWINGTYPDFIVHRREQNSTTSNPCNNLLILEFKTYYNKDDISDKGKEILCKKLPVVLDNDCDYKGAIVDYLKILDFMRENGNEDYRYLYRYGASIIIAEQEPPEWCWMNRENFRREGEQTNLPTYEPIYEPIQ